MKSKTIKKVFKYGEFVDNDLFRYIINYVNYFNIIYYENYKIEFEHAVLQYRIKNINSIMDKINRYSNKMNGEIPCQKCLNDIIGFRFIVDENYYSYLLSEVKNYISNTNTSIKYKLIDSSKDDYNAHHLYMKLTNFDFLLEIQFWNKKDENKNKESHKMYKQNYTNIERKIQEGGIENDM